MKNFEEMHEKLSNFIKLFADTFENDRQKQRFYTYLGVVIQSKLMSDLVHVYEDYPAYEIVGDFPLLDMINKYDLDKIYNQFLKRRELNDESSS